MEMTYVFATLSVCLVVYCGYLARQNKRANRWIGIMEAGVDELHIKAIARDSQIACLKGEVAYLADRNNNMRQAVECLEFALHHVDVMPGRTFVASA